MCNGNEDNNSVNLFSGNCIDNIPLLLFPCCIDNIPLLLFPCCNVVAIRKIYILVADRIL